jgi:nicotinate-nucleotide adenylyltransferase
MKIGLFGGTFDPIHSGHLILAEQAREAFHLNKVLFIPSAAPPHKSPKEITSASSRLKMIETAIQGNPFFEVSTVELERATPSYSIDTVKELGRKYPNDSLFFIIGTDSLFEMHTWYKVNELIQLCEFIYVYRPGFSVQDKRSNELQLEPEAFKVLTRHCVKMASIDISSTDIRLRVAQGRSIRYLVPESVREFIEQKGLYKEVSKAQKLKDS